MRKSSLRIPRGLRVCEECGCTEGDACIVEELDGEQRGCAWTLDLAGEVLSICDGCRPPLGEIKIRGPWRDHRVAAKGAGR